MRSDPPLLIRSIHALMAELSGGRQYRIDLDALDAVSLRELLQFLHDTDYEKRADAARHVILHRVGSRP